MAKRGRHPGRKSQTRSHNKTPKLSPYQREQKRTRLANQAPTALSVSNATRQYSCSQREVFKYLEKRDAAEAEQKLQRDADGTSSSRASASVIGKARARKLLRGSKGSDITASVSTEAKEERTNGALVSSLNATLLQGATTIESRLIQDTTLSTILRKKAKKHERKQQLRRERLDNLVEEGDARVRAELQRDKEQRSKKGGKKARKQAEAEEAAAAARARRDEGFAQASPQDGDETFEQRPTNNKSITFDGDVADVAHREMRFPGDTQQHAGGKRAPQEFYELVDVVRFGERVEGPPVLSFTPDTKSKFSRLGVKLLQAEESRPMKRRREEGDTRHSMLGGSTSIAEHKRLVKLGLADASEQLHQSSNAGQDVATKSSTRDEFADLREKVMETYRRNKASHQKSRDVGSHVFPVLS